MMQLTEKRVLSFSRYGVSPHILVIRVLLLLSSGHKKNLRPLTKKGVGDFFNKSSCCLKT